MIDHTEQHDTQTIIIKPNHSATWSTNLWVLIAILIPSLGAAIGFTAMGAWPILPLAGMELAALAGALYYVNWKLQYRQIITFNNEQIRIDKGFYSPRRAWALPREESRLAVIPEDHAWDGPSMAVHSQEHHVIVGEFLNREESLALLALLRTKLQTGTYSRPDSRRL